MQQAYNSYRKRHALLAVAAIAGIAALSAPAQGALKYWDADNSTAGLQGGTSATWDTNGATNWNTNSNPAANSATVTTWQDGDDANFSAAGTYSVSLSGTVQANSLTTNGSNVTINDGTLQLGAGGISNFAGSAGPLTINSAVTLNGSQTWATRWSSPSRITVNGNIAESVSGSVLTVGLLASSTGGVVSLSGSNTYTGGTVLNGGAASALTLQVGSNSALGSGTLTLAGGTLASSVAVSLSNVVSVSAGTSTLLDDGVANITLSGNIAGSGSLATKNVSGSGNVYLSGDNSGFTGSYTNAQRYLYFQSANAGSASASWAINGSGVMLDFGGGDVHLGALSSAVTYSQISTAANGGNYTLIVGERGDSSAFLGNLIQGTGTTSLGLTKAGNGTLTLSSAASYYTGATTLTGGILSVGTLANIGSNSSIGRGVSSNNATNAASLVINGGTLQYTGAAVSTDRLFTVGAAGGTLDASGSGAVNFNKNAAIAFSGSGNRTLTLSGSNTGANTLLPAIGNNGADVTSLAKSGDGRWVLAGVNTYSGPTTITGGTLALASGGSIDGSSRVVLSNAATFDVSAKTGGYSVKALSGSGTVAVLAGQVLTVTDALNADGVSDALSITGGGLKLGQASLFEVDLGTGVHDTASIAQGLDYNGMPLTLAFSGTTATERQFQLLSFGSAQGTPIVSFTGLSGSETANYDSSTGWVTVSVPEPATLGLAGGLSILALMPRRRTVNRK